MLGEELFARCYTYLRDSKAARRSAAQAAASGLEPPQPPPPSEAEQERTLAEWLRPEQRTAYGHITSLLFCEELLAKRHTQANK